MADFDVEFSIGVLDGGQQVFVISVVEDETGHSIEAAGHFGRDLMYHIDAHIYVYISLMWWYVYQV